MDRELMGVYRGKNLVYCTYGEYVVMQSFVSGMWQVFRGDEFFGHPEVLHSASSLEEAVAYMDGA